MNSIEEEDKKPKTKLQVDRGGAGIPPRRPTGLGMFDRNEDDDNLHSGQVVLCKIIDTDPRGFRVMILGSNAEALLVTDEHFQLGRSIRAKFDHWSDFGVAMLQPVSREEMSLYMRRSTIQLPSESVSGPVIGNDPNYKYEHSLDPIVSANRPKSLFSAWKTPFGSVFAKGFIHKSAYPAIDQDQMRRKRVLDMFITPIECNENSSLIVNSTSYLRARLEEFQKSMFTGCLIAESNTFFSRGGMLLFRGRCMGAVYSNNFETNTDDTASAMRSILMELYSPPANFEAYSLPEELVLPYSSLLVGRKIDSKAESWSSLRKEYKEEQITGVIAVFSKVAGEVILVMMYDGEPSGYFMVQKRYFSTNTGKELSNLLDSSHIDSVFAAELPEDDFTQIQYNPIDYLPCEQ